MKIKSKVLIQDLTDITDKLIKEAEALKNQSIEKLNQKFNVESWSALECIEHLNLYGDFYIEEFIKSIEKGKKPSTEFFKSGLLGDYSAKSMLPKEKLNKIKTFKDKNPLGSALDLTHIDRFIKQQNQILSCLDKSSEVSLTKTKCKTTLPMIKFRLGDTFRFVIYHNQRHIIQAKKAII